MSEQTVRDRLLTPVTTASCSSKLAKPLSGETTTVVTVLIYIDELTTLFHISGGGGVGSNSLIYRDQFDPWSRSFIILYDVYKERFSSLHGKKIILYSTPSRRVMRPTQLPSQCVRGVPFLRIKTLGRQANHSFPFNSEVKNDGAIPPLSYTSSLLGALLIMYRGFTFYL
jgi:hypothetical protein